MPSTFEIVCAVIMGIVIVVPIFVFIFGVAKSKLDKSNNNESGAWGWVIAFIIATIVMIAIFNIDWGANVPFEPRHT